MKPISANTLLKGLGEVARDFDVTAVVTDSRAVCPGSVFVCIRGERADGHDFAVSAAENGAGAVLVQHPVEGLAPEKTVLVSDPLDAMIAMGRNYRDRFSRCTVLGVTGSVGKTTTKEFCAAVFSAFGSTIKTQGNQNNELGVPNTLFSIGDDTDYAVVEMGMQGLGEIQKLTLAARPAGAIISCIGRAHLEQLGTRENILKAKMEICDGMPAGAPLVLNGDDDYLPSARVPGRLHPVYFSLSDHNADVTASGVFVSASGTRFRLRDKEFGSYDVTIPAMGEHNVRNALSAYALATRLGLDPAAAARALSQYRTTGHRQNITHHAGVTVIEDCYNANPDSMKAALRTLEAYPTQGRRIAVLGDMFELGAISDAAHTQLGEDAAQSSVAFLITVGEAARLTHRRAVALGVPAVHCADKKDAAALLISYCEPDDVVLVKASHGMAFETILDDLYAALDVRKDGSV